MGVDDESAELPDLHMAASKGAAIDANRVHAARILSNTVIID